MGTEERLPNGNWHELPAGLHGSVDTSGDTARAVVYLGGQTVHLLGYALEDEAVRAAESLRAAE